MNFIRYFTLFAVFVIFPFHNAAFASLLITPLQVVIEGRDRFATVTLVNNSNEEKTYRLLWQQFQQMEGKGGYIGIDRLGEFDMVEPEGTRYLKDFAVFSPRQVTLQPQEKQLIRVAVRRPAELADGEYKSHLKFQVLAQSRPPIENPNLGPNEISLGARLNASFSIPVVYRVGDYNIDVDIQAPSFNVTPKTGNMVVNVPVNRAGTHGVIGHIDVFHAPNGGSEELIGSLGNANLFPEITTRNFTVPTSVSGIQPGTLRIVFKKAEGLAADHEVLDQKSFPIQN